MGGDSKDEKRLYKMMTDIDKEFAEEIEEDFEKSLRAEYFKMCKKNKKQREGEE